MVVATRLHHTGMVPGQVKECQPGHEARTHSHHGRHPPPIIMATADRTCTLMDTEIETASVIVIEPLLGTDPWLAEAMSTPTSQPTASVNANANENARGTGTGTGIETGHPATAGSVVDRRLLEGCLTGSGTMRETAGSMAAHNKTTQSAESERRHRKLAQLRPYTWTAVAVDRKPVVRSAAKVNAKSIRRKSPGRCRKNCRGDGVCSRVEKLSIGRRLGVTLQWSLHSILRWWNYDLQQQA